MNDIEQVELSIELAQKHIDRKKTFLRLAENKDFQAIIEDGYFEHEASRLVLLKADPQMQTEADQELILKQIDAIGFLRQHLRTIVGLGSQSEKALVADQETLDELHAETLKDAG